MVLVDLNLDDMRWMNLLEATSRALVRILGDENEVALSSMCAEWDEYEDELSPLEGESDGRLLKGLHGEYEPEWEVANEESLGEEVPGNDGIDSINLKKDLDPFLDDDLNIVSKESDVSFSLIFFFAERSLFLCDVVFLLRSW